jgi:hypothetical protein
LTAASSETDLASALGDLHRAAGKPTSRKIAAAIGPISHTTVAVALAGRRTPSWPILEKIVVHLGGDVEAFRALWAAAVTPDEDAGESGSTLFAKRYRQQATVLHQFLINPHHPYSQRTEFETAYTPPRLTPVGTAADPLQAIDFSELAVPGGRSVVLGSPGSGKSAMCQALLRRISSEPGERLPFLIRLREFADQSPPTRSVVEHIEHQTRATYQLVPPPGAVTQALSQGRAVVILDGLDELVHASRRADAVAIIELFAKSFPRSSIVVTSRQLGYQDAPLDSRLFQTYRIENFSEEEVERFVRRWFRSSSSKAPVPDPDELAAGFLADSSFLPDLRRSPLLLSLMCSVYAVARVLPTNLPELYEKCAELLFKQWDQVRGINNDIRPSTVRPALAHLSYVILENPADDPWLTSRRVIHIMTDFFESRMSDRDEAESLARDFLTWCAGRAGVLTKVGTIGLEPVYGFTHRTFLDYFAALKLSRDSTDPRRLAHVLTPRIAVGEWPMVGQIAVQLADRNVEGAAARIASEMLEMAGSLPVDQRERVVQFLETCAELVAFPAPVLREIDKSSGRLGAAGRICVAIDISGFAARSAISQAELQTSLAAPLNNAFRQAGVQPESLFSMAAGDGWFHVLPASIDEAITIPRVIEGLKAALAAANQGRSPSSRLRLRVAFNRGQVQSTSNGVVGFAVVEAYRMLDSPPLRVLMNRHSDADLAVALSDEVHAELDQHTTPRVLERFDRALIESSKDRPSLSFWVQAA